MKHSPHWIGTRLRGFTLLEMLVSAAILVLLIAMTAQVTNSATTTITANRNRMDADSVARMVFDRMAADFDMMLKRKDVDYVCKGASASVTPMSGNDRFFFYSEAPAYYGSGTNNSSVALTGYRVSSHSSYYTGVPVLERLGKGLLRDGSGNAPGAMVFLCYPDASTLTPALESTLLGNWASLLSDASSDGDYHVIAPQVFRFEVCYLLKPYTQSDGTPVPAKYSNVPYNFSDKYHQAVNGFQDVSAIVIAIAILDDASRKMLPNAASNITAMAGKLDDPVDADLSASQPLLMAEKWNKAIKEDNFLPTGVPRAVAAQLRIYQRHFYLNNLVCN